MQLVLKLYVILCVVLSILLILQYFGQVQPQGYDVILQRLVNLGVLNVRSDLDK